MKAEKPVDAGTLYVVATPIGNLGDITLRALETLRSVDRIAAEDTRHTRKLLSHYDIHKPLLSYHSHNIERRGPLLLESIGQGEDIALVSDAGTPGISDPGTKLVQQALAMGVKVTAIPGPTALIMALVTSGLPTHPFAFLGFPPAQGTGRGRFFSTYASLPMTLVLFESPQRLRRTLGDLLRFWGNRRIAVARELTKRYEEIFRGTMAEAQLHFAGPVKGELTLVLSGAAEQDRHRSENNSWSDDLRRLLQQEGLSVKEAAEQIARRYRVPKRTIYQEALKMKGSDP